MKEKQDIFRNIYSVSTEKCRGYLLWFVKHPKPFKHTTREEASEKVTAKSSMASYADTK